MMSITGSPFSMDMSFTNNSEYSLPTEQQGTISTTEFSSGQTQTYNVTLIKDNSNHSRQGYWLIDSVQP